MLNLKEIKTFYPESLHNFERFIIREYLQYKILEIIFETPYESKLAFLGGTCLRIVYNNSRFSEDLDFDNFDLSMNDFNEITQHQKIFYLLKNFTQLSIEKETKDGIFSILFFCWARGKHQILNI